MNPNQKNTQIVQKALSYPLAVAQFVFGDLASSFRKDYASFGISLAKYYFLFIALKFTTRSVFRKIIAAQKAKKWSRVAKKKRRKTRESFRRSRDQIVNSKENNPKDIPGEIQEKLPYASIADLHAYLIKKEVSCVQLLNFYFKRAVDYGLELNLLTEPLYDLALDLAQKNDKILSGKLASKEWTTVTDLPPLFGIPVTLKDQYQVEGSDVTLGASARAFKPHKDSGLAVKLIIEAGGVPFAKTNIPQIFLATESHNNIFGRSINLGARRDQQGDLQEGKRESQLSESVL